MCTATVAGETPTNVAKEPTSGGSRTIGKLWGLRAAAIGIGTILLI